MSMRPLFASAIALGLCPGVACADPLRAHQWEQNEAHAAVQSGEIKPLDVILAKVKSGLGGEIVRVSLHRNGSRWIYEFRVVDTRGLVRDVLVDASAGDILGVEHE